MAKLNNLTMTESSSVNELGQNCTVICSRFSCSGCSIYRYRSIARLDFDWPSLPSRVHLFIEDLLAFGYAWTLSVPASLFSERGGPTGKLYSKPRILVNAVPRGTRTQSQA
jgi:hypothetical protein